MLSWLAILSGFALLVWSADRFVLGASAIANNFGISPIIIGMIIMGFGTSAPEMFVAGMAAMDNSSGIAVGNAIGSNIANIALVLGIAALIAPITVDSQTLKQKFPALFIATLLALALLYDLTLSRIDGAILLASTGIMVFWLVRMCISNLGEEALKSECESKIPSTISNGSAIMWTIGGLILLVGSSHLLVWGATDIARSFGVSNLLIGLTVVAVGTSLPELAVTVTAALKKQHDIAVGNILGSNMFNMLAVLGVAGSIQSSEIPPEVLARDYPVMLGLTIALFVMAYGYRRAGRINRFEALLLLLTYIGYMIWLYQTEVGAKVL